MDKYLLEILKDSNTIIIPGLGALTVTNKETGETMFMPYLQHDDGKLAAFIAQKDGIEEADAKNMVAKYVREIKSELDKGETYSMFNLGTFVKKDDGDIEFKNWSNTTEETVPPVAAPIVEETAVEEVKTDDELEEAPEPTPEPEISTEPIAVSEPEPEPIVEIEPEVVPEPEPIIEPEPFVEPEPVVAEPEPIVESEPIVTPEPIEPPKEEIELRETISEAIKNTPEPEPEVIIPESTTLEPSPLLDDIAPTSAVALDPEMEPDVENATDGESEEEDEKKKKAGVGFWITLIIIALGIIAGGAYVGRNYNDIKQHIPFLADNDEEAEKKSLQDEMSNVIKEDKYANPDRTDGQNDNPDSEGSGEEGFMEDGQGEGDTEGSGETMEVEPQPEPEVTTPEITPPTPINVSSSSSGPFKVIAGAFSSLDNANRLAAEFKAKGLNSEVFPKGELHAVSMQSYATSEEANSNLAKLQSMAPGAWIYYKR